MKHYMRFITGIGIALSLVISSLTTSFAEIPKAYWQYQKPFQDAVSAKNNAEIIKNGTEITKLFQNAPSDEEKAGILYSTYEGLYPAYESQGDYDMAVRCLKAMIPYGQQLGFSDGVKIAQARIRKIDPMTQVYALTSNTAQVPYYGMKNEPKNGTYYGRVYTEDGLAPMEEETAISFYVECLQENIADYDYKIRPFANGKKIIHIALNMPNENDTLKQVMQSSSDAYIQSTMKYLNSLNVPVLLRIGGEMNVWQNLADPDLYKQAYLKIAQSARQTAPNVALVFSPNEISNWAVDIDDYYPGDNFVDWVGVSLYTDKFRNFSNPVAGEDFEEMYYGNGIYANPLTKLRDIVERYGNKKPIIITEGGTGHTISTQNTDLTSFAKDRVNELYTYATMLYPQVKGIIYFDVDIDKSKYIYALSKNSAVMEQYKTTTAQNKTLIHSIGTTPASYTKLENYQDNQTMLSLYTYCILPKTPSVTVQYNLDGNSAATASQIPYACSIDTAKLSAGNHELEAVVTASNGYQKTLSYKLSKSADGTITITQ